MKRLILFIVFAIALPLDSGASTATAGTAAGSGQNTELQRWEQRARNITITRDDWGIAHIYGKTDADAVFGAIYAQAEDDFNRVETNYLNSMGRLAEAVGESAVWRDLRMKLFIDPETLKKQYETSPSWLKALMDAWADGLNFYLAKHPQVKPRVIKRFEPWMALSFTEGSIGGDIETISLAKLESFYGNGLVADRSNGENELLAEPAGSNGIAVWSMSARRGGIVSHSRMNVVSHGAWRPGSSPAFAFSSHSAKSRGLPSSSSTTALVRAA